MVNKKDASSDLTIRDKLITTVIGLPLTYGLTLLCGHLEGVEKSGWIWWPSLLGLVFIGFTTIAIGCSLVWDFILSTGIVTGADQVIGWIVQGVLYIGLAWGAIYLISDIFDDLNKIEFSSFALGGFVVYLFLNRDR